MGRVYKLGLIVNISLLLILIFVPDQVDAQWPPFNYRLTPSYENGQITYNLRLSSGVNWLITDLAIKIPLPEGTRFLEANTIPTIEASFDGAEVTFFIPALSQRVRDGDASFTVEVIDPRITVFTTHTWIAWQGDQPGNYLTENVVIDITGQSLNWESPPQSRLRLDAVATVVDNVITYTIYPRNVGGRMQDVRINVPLPERTVFLSAQASPPFLASFDGREVSFSAIELERWAEVDPLSFKVSTKEVTAPLVTTHAWATWNNVSRAVGRKIAIQEETITGDIIVEPDASQQVVADVSGDVPLSDYDITSIALQEVLLEENKRALKINIHTNGQLGPVGGLFGYTFYIDSDCRTDSGKPQGHLGVEYRIRYRHEIDQADIRLWDNDEKRWTRVGQLESDIPVGGKMVTLWAPYDFLEQPRQFCWLAEGWNTNQAFNSILPIDRVPNNRELRITRYEVVAPANQIDPQFQIVTAEPAVNTSIGSFDVWQYLPGWSEPPIDWKTTNFDDDSWFSGTASIGYGADDIGTDLSQISAPIQDSTSLLTQHIDKQSGMILATLPSGNDANSVFIRRSFIVDNPLPTQLTLELEYEGGFVAYLNGVEVARRGFDTTDKVILHDTLAADREAGISTEVIDLSPYIPNLVAGSNVLAIQAHRAVGSSNLSINPQLTWVHNPADITPPSDTTTISAPIPVEMPSITDIRGKIAVPIDNGRVTYDIHVFSIPDGEEIATILNARQPNFRFDGQRLLINREGSGVENVYEYDLIDWTEQQVSDAPRDSHPFYDPWGNRVVYGNPELTVGSPVLKRDERGKPVRDENGELITLDPRKPFIFIQCGLLPPHQETEPRCRDIPNLGVLVPAGQMGEIQGTHPVWTANDMIAYKGCNTWAGSKLCGIYIVPPSSTKGFSDGFIPRQLTRDASDTPSDTKGNLIAFSSQRDGDWEAYVMDLDGNGVKNLSNSPSSNDGLPTISPDGNWVAFVSDRGGQWAIWVVPVLGGSPQKLFDLPSSIPWGDGDRAWINERISWGP